MTSSLTRPPVPTPEPAEHRPAREAATYLGLVATMVLTIAVTLSGAGDLAPLLSMGTPVVAVGLITALRTPRGARRELWGTFGLRHAGWRSWPAAFVISVVSVFIVPFGVADVWGSARFIDGSSINVPSAAINLVMGLATVTLMAMAEEIGWRSYLLPRMQALLPRRRAAVAVGFAHGLFHLPLILLTSTYDSVGSRWVVAPVVVLSLTAAGVFYAWLKDRSGSVWPVAFAHGTVNVFIDGSGLVVVLAPVALAYTATESGLATLGAITAISAILLVRGRTWGAGRQAVSGNDTPVFAWQR
jgi:membrane protease YdiL (CAAX protease family)